MRLPWLVMPFVATLPASCSRGPPAPSVALVVASGPPATAPTSPQEPPDSLACSIAAGYRGQVLGLPVFARLAREGTGLRGRYFYERTGLDLPLQGSLSDDGTLHLVEGGAVAPTGRFEGRCEPATGAFAGTWHGAKSSGEFRWSPIPPGESPVVAVKRFAISRPVRHPDPEARITQCSYRESRLELFGLRDSDVERKLDRQGVDPLHGALLAPDLALAAEKCAEGSGSAAEMNEVLIGAFRELATIERGGWIDAGGAHPSDLDLARMTVDLRTGRPVVAQDVFAPSRDPIEHVATCAAKAKPYDVEMEAEEWRAHLDLSQFDLAEDGIHFFATDFPHVSAVLAGQGPIIGYDVLLRDGYLRSDSPVKRAWRGVEPAPKGKPWCPDMSVDAGWR